MSADFTDADYATLAAFRYSLRQFLAFSEDRVAGHGLTPKQHQALLAIRAAPADGATIGYVAERLIVKPHSASGLIDRLVALGLVERRASSTDRRRTFLVLTAEALGVLAQLSVAHREEILRLRPMLVDLLQTMADS